MHILARYFATIQNCLELAQLWVCISSFHKWTKKEDKGLANMFGLLNSKLSFEEHWEKTQIFLKASLSAIARRTVHCTAISKNGILSQPVTVGWKVKGKALQRLWKVYVCDIFHTSMLSKFQLKSENPNPPRPLMKFLGFWMSPNCPTQFQMTHYSLWLRNRCVSQSILASQKN